LLAVVAAVLLAFVPRLPSSRGPQGLGLSTGSVRITGSTSRRLRVFAVTQIAASFVLLAGASMLVKTLLALQAAPTGLDTRRVLALNVPGGVANGRTPEQNVAFYKEAMRRITDLPGVDRVAVGTVVPWRDAGSFGPGFAFSADLGVPIIAGRDFNESDRRDSESVVIVSQTLAQRLFPNQEVVNRRLMWTDPVMKFIDVSTAPRRIVGVAADIDDENVIPGPAMVVYHPMDQEMGGGRLFVHARTDPYALVPPITRIIRGLSADQPVEQAATLDDVKAEVLAPNRLNAMVFSGFAGVALTIAVVGVAGVLAFSVIARTREFGVRLAVGSTPRHLLGRILGEGAVIACAGIAAGVVGGIALARVVGVFVQDVSLPGALPLLGAATILVAAAILASLMPAARASRVDVMQALRSE